MKYGIRISLYLLIAASIFVPLRKSALCDVVDTVVAVVNDDAITQSEIDMMISPIYSKLIEQYQGNELLEKLNQARGEALEKIIEGKLIFQEANRLGIIVDEADVEEQLEEVRSRFSSPEEFESELQQQGLTIEDLKDKYREQIMSSILVARKVRSNIFIFPSEVATYYNGHKEKFKVPESVQLWNILVRVEEDADDNEAQKQATRVQKMIIAGADFSSMARKYSQGPFAEKGGYMGFVKKDQLRPELDKVIFKLNKDEVSNPVRSKLGYHIFKAGEKMPARTLRMDEVRQQIEDMIYAKKSEVEYQKWIKKLKEDAYIDIKQE